MEGGRDYGEGKGNGGMGKGGEKGEVGGIAPFWLLGDRRPCRCHLILT